MKKYIVLAVLMLGVCVGGFAQYNPAEAYGSFTAPNQQQSKEEPQIIRLSREGDLKGLRLLLAKEANARHFETDGGYYYPILLQTDAHGNNVLHVAANAEVFSFLSSVAYSKRDELMSQKNKAGETPWMSLISYDRAGIFMRMFMYSALRQKMKAVTKELKSTGVNRMVAEIKRDALIRECSAGGQNMWQRADALWRMAPQGSAEKATMLQVRNMIGKAAPFLIR